MLSILLIRQTISDLLFLINFSAFDFNQKNSSDLSYFKNLNTNVGDEGGFAPNFSSSKDVMDEIMLSNAEAGYKPEDQLY